MDNDLGYGVMRVDEAQEWKRRLPRPAAVNFVTACIFEYGIAMFDLDLGDHLREKRQLSPEKKVEVAETLAKARRHWPRTTSSTRRSPGRPGDRRWRPTRPPTCSATCGATRSSCAATSPRACRRFEQPELDEQETKGEWYVRQMLGSANISGSRRCT